MQHVIDGWQTADAMTIAFLANWLKEGLRSTARGCIQESSIGLTQSPAVRLSEGGGIAKYRPNMSQIGSCNNKGSSADHLSAQRVHKRSTALILSWVGLLVHIMVKRSAQHRQHVNCNVTQNVMQPYQR
jgi:hypothetical protein